MAEGNPAKSFYVQLPGYEQGEIWDEEKYNRNKEQLFKDHPDVQAVETSPLGKDDEITDEGLFTVHLPGYEKAELWDGAKLSRNREQLLKDHPDAEIVKATPVNYYGDQLTDIYSKMESLEEELKGIPEPVRDINMSDAAALEMVQDSPERRRRNEINAELDQLRREREKNPAWQAYWENQRQDLGDSAEKAKGDAKANKGELEGEYYDLASRFYKDALKTANAPSKYDDTEGWASLWQGTKNFAKGVGQNVMTAASVLEFAKSLDNLYLIDTVKEIQATLGKDANISALANGKPEDLDFLSNGQREMLKAFVRKAEVEAGRADNTSIGYNAGKSAIQSLGFMADFLLTGGVGEAAGKAAAQKLVGTTTEKIAAKTFTEAMKKTAVGSLEGAVKALVMTPMMPSSYSNFLNNLTVLNENGQMDLSAKSVLNSLGDVLIENFSENAGELFGIPFEGKFFDAISKTKLGEVGKAMSRTGAGQIMRQAGWHGLVGEMAEEVLGNAMRSWTGVDDSALANFFKKDEFFTTLASFAPMSIIGGVSSGVQIRKAGKKMTESGEELKKILSGIGFDNKTVGEMLDVSKYETPEELGSALTAIGKKAIDTGNVTGENIKSIGKALGDYAIAASEYKTLRGVFEDKRDADRAMTASYMDQEIGDSSWRHAGEGGNFVRTITDADGNESFVVSSDDSGVAVIAEGGQKSFISRKDLEEGVANGTLVDSGDRPVDEFLDEVSEARKKAEEARRMEREEQDNITAIQSVIAANPEINIGTQEAPVTARVTMTTKSGVVVEWMDSDGKSQQKPMSWREVGQYLGAPTEVKTDEQIEIEQAEAEEEVSKRKDDYNNTIPEGTQFDVTLIEGDMPVAYKFKRAFIGEDGNLMLQVTDMETGKEEQITEEMAMAGNLPSIIESIKNPVAEEKTAAEAPAETPAPVEDDGVLRDFRGNEIPLKDDGMVNQAAFWTKDPEAWARWNDEKRGDGGVNSRGYIAKAVKKLQSDAKAVEKQIGKELDFDKIDQLEGQLGDINKRIAELNKIEKGYADVEVAQAEAVQTPEESPAPVAETTEAAPVAEATQTQEDAEAARVQALKDRIRAWVERTGVEADALESVDQVQNKQAAKAIAEGQPVAGWFEPNTGKVVIYLPNILDEAEIDRTYMHEVISHKGLRDMLGNEGWNTLMDSVWDNIMTEKDKADYLKYNSHLKGTEEFLRRAAADEYVAHLAENVNTENMGAWQKFVEMVKEILLKLGMDVKLTTEDLSNLLQASLANYERMQTEKRAAEQPAVSEEMQRIADILSGKDETNYTGHFRDNVDYPIEAYDEVVRQWDTYKKAMEEERAPLQRKVSELVDRVRKEEEQKIIEAAAKQGKTVGETTLYNVTVDRVDTRLKSDREYQDLTRQIDAIDASISPQAKESFRQNAIGMLKQEYATEDATGFVKEGDKLTSYMDAPTGQESPSAPDETLFSLKREEDSKDDEGKTVPGLRTLADGFLAKLADKPLTPEELAIGSDAIGEMVNYMMPYLDKVKDGKRYLPEEIFGKGWSTIFKNGSYGRTMENTLICMRTLAYNDFVNAVQEKVGRPLTPTESFLASQMLYDIATDPQCLYCYVALDRKAYNGFLKTYIEQRDAVLDKYKADDSIDKTYRLPAQAKSRKNRKGLPADNQVNKLYLEYLDGRADTPSMRNRFNGWLDRIAEGTLIGMKDLTSPETRQKVAAKGASYASQIDDAEKYAQSASWAKKQEEYRAYNGELLSMPQKVVNLLNSEYGLRFYSFSEYSPAFIVENMQMVRDAALRGLVGLAYTKEIDFAKIFAPTGININISLYGREAEDGTVVMDTKQGADWGEAQTLREKYGNVGCVFVATNDKMVEWALHQPWIDVIIPFHIVRTGEDIAKFYDWTNYTAMEADKDAIGRARDIMPTEHMNDKDTFLRLCEERGLKPRFADLILPSTGRSVTEDPDYMKLVNETRRSVNETVPIKPIFDVQEARRSFDEFVDKGGYYAGWFTEEGAFERGVEQVAADVEAGKTAKDVDYGRQDIKASAEKLAAMAGKKKRPRSHQGTPRRIGGETITKAQQNVLNYLETGEFKSEREPLEVANATQKQPASDAAQPVVTEEDVMDVAMFRLSKNNKATVESWLKKREDINDEQRAEVVDYIDKLDDAKTQLATAKWFANGTIRIPEDMKKVQQAISVAGKAKVDPLRYNSPMELLDAHADFKPSEERINPDEVSTLHRAAEYPDGIVVYDVDNTKESRENMRKIINTHFGEDASPWCLLQGDGKGNLTADSARYWRHYNAYPKQVAFKDGKLLAFSANDRATRLWWDRKDESHYGIPITQKVEGDELGRSAYYIIENGELVKEPGTHLFKGNKQNGVYEEWSTDGSQILIRENYKNGQEDGMIEEWFPNGQIARRVNMKEGDYVGLYESWYDNGQQHVILGFTEEGYNNGDRKTWWKNGNPQSDGRYNNGKPVGEHSSWDEEGYLTSVQYYSEDSDYLGFEDHGRFGIARKVTFTEGDGQIDERFYRGGRIQSIARTKNGKLEGLQEYFYADGVPQTRSEYSNGERNGIFERYHPNGKLMAKGEYKNGVREGIHELYDKYGDLISRQEYHNDEKVRELPLDENVQFRLSNSQQMDQDYMATVESGDMDTAQRMVDEMAEASGYTIRGYHGTTHDFTIFDRSKGNAEGNWGKGFYFTNNEDDADANYAGEGPDLTNRIELLAENMEWMDGYEDMDYEQRLEEARKQLSGDNPHVISAAIRMENPLILDSRGGQEETYFDYNDNYNQETDEYEGEPTGRLVDFVEAWNDVLSDWEWEGNNVSPDEILEYANYEGLTASQLEEKAREILAYVENSEGQVATGEFLRQVFERMGFDGIVDNNVNQKFGTQRRYGRGMDGVDYGTAHVIAFKSNQIKQTDPVTYDNEGNVIPLSKRFDSWNDDIRFRKANRSQNGFISNAEMALDDIKMDKATPDQWIKMLEKSGGLKAGEDKWIGLSDWLKESGKKTVTKQEIADYIDEHRIQIEETHYSENVESEYAEAIQSYRDEFRDLVEETGSYDGAFNEMIERYGDDFSMAFEQDGDNIIPTNDWGDYLSGAAEYFLDRRREGPEVRPINSTRMDYTTEGLDNKREIALTVPTIEPWNEGDNIHFGDAGEGRAVAWVRFGDATINDEGEFKAEDRYRRADKEYRSYMAELIDKHSPERRAAIDAYDEYIGRFRDGRTPTQEEMAELKRLEAERNKVIVYDESLATPDTPEEKAKLEELESEAKRLRDEWRNGKFHKTKVLVIDEIQSKRHQEGREKGYKKDLTEDERKEIANAGEEYKTLIAPMKEKYGAGIVNPGNFMGWPEVTDEDRETMKKAEAIRQRVEEMRRNQREAIPVAPFEKNWHELAMKRMLRLAAEEGYDKVAWTTGDQQADRYNIGNYVSSIDRTESDEGERSFGLYMGDSDSAIEVVTDDNGLVLRAEGHLSQAEGHPLADLVGKEVAVRMMRMDVDDVLEDVDLKVGNKGMTAFYDAILPHFMNKYGKKWGVKVEDLWIPNIGGRTSMTMHSVDVTQEMKESVMEGQVMFSKKADEVKEFSETIGPIVEWAKPESLARAYKEDGSKMSREEIFEKFSNAPEQVATIPAEYLPIIGEGLTDNKVYCSEAYFIDHAVNNHESTSYDEYMQLQDVIDNNDDIKEVYDRGKRSVVFVKRINSARHKYAGMSVQLEVNDEGKIVWHKTYFAQKREPYKNYPSIKPSESRPSADATPQSSVPKAHGSKRNIPALDDQDKDTNLYDNSNTFSEENSDIRFSLRGIIGAENAEDEAALDNLEVAEEMENAGKDSPTIWRATGWERGADGKWRNEIPDAKQKEGVSLKKHNIAGEILDAPELFDSYPELAEMPIDLVNSATAGAYNQEQKRITLDTDYNTTFEMSKEDKKKVEDSTIDFIRNGIWKRQSDIVKFKNGLSEQYGKLVLNSNGIATLLHELQHAIQQIEGFAKGTNEKLGERLYYKEALKTKPEETYFAWFLSRKNSAKKLNQVGRERVTRYAENYDKSRLVDEDLAYLNKLIDYLKGISDDEYKKLVSRAAKIVKAAEKAGEANYEKSAGEVEARNVERRSTLSDEKRQKYSPDATEEYSRSEQIVQFRKVTDPATLERLESEEKIPVYASKQFIEDPNGDAEYDFGDGRGAVKGFLVAPMSGKVEGKWRDPERLGDFQEAEERPDLVNEKGEFILDKGNGDTLKVAYAPYNHLRRSPLNEQFSSAYKRPNLVIVKGEIPASELTSGYTAEKSKKSTGEHDWPSGKVSNVLAKKGQDTRKVILSRWFKPIEVVPASKVADEIVKKIDDAGIKVSFNYNVVTPTLRRELVKRGVKFSGWQGKKPDDWKEQVQRMQEENNDIVLFRRSQDLFNESHEGGLTRVIGEDNVSDFYMSVYKALPKQFRERIVADAMGNGMNFREAISGRLSEIARDGYENDDTGILLMTESLLNYYAGEVLDPNTVRYILWRGERSRESEDTLDNVTDLAMRRRMKVGEFSDEVRFSKIGDNIEEAQTRADSMADDAKQTLEDNKRQAKEDKALTTIKAMSLQKEYDKKTVNTISVLAKNLIKDQAIDAMSRREIARLLGIITTSVGKAPKTVKKNADTLIGMVIDHLLKSERDKLNKLTKISGTKTNQTGVVTAKSLDVKGQKTIRQYRDAISKVAYVTDEDGEKRIDTRAIEGELAEAYEALGSSDATERADAETRIAGLVLARDYLRSIQELSDEEDEWRKSKSEADKNLKSGAISREAHRQQIAEIEAGIRDCRIRQIEAIREHSGKLAGVIAGSMESLKDFREREKERVEKIHHYANSDMKGVPTDEPGNEKNLLNSLFFQTVLGPLATFNQFFRLFGRRNAYGRGYLYNHFVVGQRKAQDAEFVGLKEAIGELDAKTEEIFGKGVRFFDLGAIARSVDHDNRKAGKTVTMKIRVGGGTQAKEIELSQSQLLYIYAVDKMRDGRMKLRGMNITEEQVDAIKDMLDERFVRFIDWVQEEYLVKLRNKYNGVHERLFGASMSAIDNYFPLRISKRDIWKEEDIESDPFAPLPSTTTGAIIKRKTNIRAIDLENADAFDVLYDHVKEMEHWAAFADYIKDINTLISYKRFHNQVTSMKTAYGTGDTLWKNFRDVLTISIGKYHPKPSKPDKAVTLASRAVSVAKVAFRVNTAIKQFASIMAFLPDVSMKNFAYAVSHIRGNWKWAMRELPSFAARWEGGNIGNEKLEPRDSELRGKLDDALDFLQKYGMKPNKFIDALTVSIGARAVYLTSKERYLKEGYTEDQAEEKAKVDAVTAFNETQQSSEGGFLSAIQRNRDFISSSLSVFRNASFSYTRKAFGSLRALTRMMRNKDGQIEAMTKQFVRDGFSEEKAKENAEKEYKRARFFHAATIATSVWVNTILWNMFSHLWYYLLGDDDDKKKEYLREDVLRGLIAGPIEGLAGGNVVSEMVGNKINGESLFLYSPSLNPLLSDLQSLYSSVKNDPVKGANEVINLASQVITGVNPQTFTDIVVAIVDACHGDLDTSKEALLLMLRVIQAPQSQIEQLYIDELGTTADKARRMSYTQMAERYAEYKLNRETPLTGWAYSDEERAKKIKSKEKTFKSKVNERKKLDKRK